MQIKRYTLANYLYFCDSLYKQNIKNIHKSIIFKYTDIEICGTTGSRSNKLRLSQTQLSIFLASFLTFLNERPDVQYATSQNQTTFFSCRLRMQKKKGSAFLFTYFPTYYRKLINFLLQIKRVIRVPSNYYLSIDLLKSGALQKFLRVRHFDTRHFKTLKIFINFHLL